MGSFGGGGKTQGTSGNSAADAAMAQWALGQNEQAIHNRYQQLGIGVPAGGTSGAQAAASGQNLAYGGPSTMERQDIGTIPTESGGAIGVADALLGQLYNPQAAAGLGPGGAISQLQQLAGQQAQSATGAGIQSTFGGG